MSESLPTLDLDDVEAKIYEALGKARMSWGMDVRQLDPIIMTALITETRYLSDLVHGIRTGVLRNHSIVKRVYDGLVLKEEREFRLALELPKIKAKRSIEESRAAARVIAEEKYLTDKEEAFLMLSRLQALLDAINLAYREIENARRDVNNLLAVFNSEIKLSTN